MAEKHLNIPHDLNLKMNADDTLCIHVTETCTWCYTDADDCFPNGLLPAGTYSPSENGPYADQNPGVVSFNAVPGADQPCTPDNGKIRGPGHTIQVGGSGL